MQRNGTTNTQESPEPKFPRSWLWSNDGDEFAATYDSFDEGMTRDYGPRPIFVGVIAGERRSVWLNETALRNRFADEVARRASGDLTPGERVTVKRLGKKMGGNGRTYTAFEVDFPDRPRRSAREIFDVEPSAPSANDTEGAKDDEDGIPF
jgi:hypothetical protein